MPRRRRPRIARAGRSPPGSNTAPQWRQRVSPWTPRPFRYAPPRRRGGKAPDLARLLAAPIALRPSRPQREFVYASFPPRCDHGSLSVESVFRVVSIQENLLVREDGEFTQDGQWSLRRINH